MQLKSSTTSHAAWLEHPFVDRWLPRGAATEMAPRDLLRMRIASSFLQGLAVLALTFGIVDAASGLYALSCTSFGGLLLAMVVLWRMRRGASLVELAVTSSATMFAVLVSNAALNGGLDAPALFFLPIVPIVSLMMDAPRVGRGWVGISIATVVGFFVTERVVGLPFPHAMTEDMLPLNKTLVVSATCAFVYGGFLLHTTFGRWIQQRLLEAEAQRLDLILDTAGDAIVRLDTTWSVASGNAAARELFGVESLTGTSIDELLPSARSLAHASGATVLDANGAEGRIPVEATCTFLDDGWVLVIRDIRERMRAQRALQQALEEAEGASLAKSRFLASMSHELRTPLNAVIGYAEMVAEDIDAGTPPTDGRDLQRIVGSARHLLALIDQVLDLAKVEAGRMEVEHREVPLLPFLGELATIGRTLARGQDNRFEAQLPDADVTVVLDELRTRQIVLNLLSNAAKFCASGQIGLEVVYERERLVMRVSDTGIGMTREQLASVWEEFSQAERSTHRLYGGTGLGLPLARRLTDLLGGELRARSAPGDGTHFELALPVPRAPASGGDLRQA